MTHFPFLQKRNTFVFELITCHMHIYNIANTRSFYLWKTKIVGRQRRVRGRFIRHAIDLQRLNYIYITVIIIYVSKGKKNSVRQRQITVVCVRARGEDELLPVAHVVVRGSGYKSLKTNACPSVACTGEIRLPSEKWNGFAHTHTHTGSYTRYLQCYYYEDTCPE